MFFTSDNIFKFSSVDFKDGMVSCEVDYSVGEYTASMLLMKDREDGEIIAKASLALYHGKDTVSFEIQPTSGVHDVYVKVDRDTKIYDMRFSNVSPFERSAYVPADKVKADNFGFDGWEAVDMLGRKIVSSEDVGAKNGKKVGLFYWTWHERAVGAPAISLVDTFKKYPDAEYNVNHPVWEGKNGCCHWNEPLFGFYRNSDAYVLRRHAVMLAAAGVDFIVFDCTNGAFLWKSAYMPLLEEFRKCLDDGINVPKIAFMLNFYPGEPSERMLRHLYNDMYKPGKFKDLWFMHEGKPLVIGFKECLPETGVCEKDTEMLNEMREFFTFRPPQPVYKTTRESYHHKDHWGWLEMFPQNKYCERPDGSCEMVTVGVAQNANKDRTCTFFNDEGTFGRSYTHKYGHSKLTEDSYKYGYNFQEQWDRAIDLSPDMVFVTGWNEWTVQKSLGKPWILDEASTKVAFVDQFDYEHSRDIEPDCDGYLDTYYLQLTSNIRRFKGTYPMQRASDEKQIDVKGGFSQWKDVTPYYKNPKGLAAKRDCAGFAGSYYKNESGRNEIIGAKVTRDENNVYFYAECTNDITKPDGDGWMTLLLNVEGNDEKSWNGYNFAINRLCPKSGKASVEKYAPTSEENSFTWETVGQCRVTVRKNKLMLEVPRALIGCEDAFDIRFKWSDNMQTPTVMDFYLNGSSAPYGRFNYRYKI